MNAKDAAKISRAVSDVTDNVLTQTQIYIIDELIQKYANKGSYTLICDVNHPSVQAFIIKHYTSLGYMITVEWCDQDRKSTYRISWSHS